MNQRDLGLYYSILHLCDRIDSKVKRFKIDEDIWYADEDMRDLLYVSVQQIGEKAAKLRAGGDSALDFPQIDWPAIVGLRNVMVHDFDNKNPDIVWSVVQDDHPALRRTLLDNDEVAAFYHNQLDSSAAIANEGDPIEDVISGSRRHF